MTPTLLAIKAAVVLAATEAQATAKTDALAKRERSERYNLGREHAFREVLRLIETVSKLESEGSL